MPTLMRMINILSRAGAVYRTDRLGSDELRACHHSYVLAICRHPGMSQDELAAHICTNKSTVARHLAHLEKNGFVERRPNPDDRRITCVYPTEKMLSVRESVAETTHSWNSFLTEELSEEELNAFNAILEKMVAKARGYIDGKSEVGE